MSKYMFEHVQEAILLNTDDLDSNSIESSNFSNFIILYVGSPTTGCPSGLICFS